jgi:hypothetical protein
MTIRLFFLLLALIAASLNASAYEAPCFEKGKTQEFRNFGDFGAVQIQHGDCEAARITPFIYECRHRSGSANVYDWMTTGRTGTPFFIVSVHGEEVAYFYDLQQAKDFIDEEDCSGEL